LYQKSAFTTFDPPGSIETIPNSINPSGAITGYYFDGNIFHGFLRSRQGKKHEHLVTLYAAILR